jgi:two-component system phosphate regulon sensor histidine kinase PhoR
MHDVTESKNTEKMLSDFVANASHEIRTPLASLIGFVELLQTTAKDDPAAREQFLKIMADQGERMSRLVSDLLSLSKIEMNANTPPSEFVRVESAIHAAIDQNRWSSKERNITIAFNREAPLPEITGDSHELTQLFTNLLSNAVKYSHADSTVTVSTGICETIPREATHAERLERMLFISVQDQGDGIEKEHLPRLTERFYRVDNARTRKNKVGGTGLGLSIVKHILRRHKGELGIESTVGVGSRFTVYLPLSLEG